MGSPGLLIHQEPILLLRWVRFRGHSTQRTRGRATVSEAAVWRWTVQLMLALHYLHSKRVLHRDLKSQVRHPPRPLLYPALPLQERLWDV